MLIPAFLAFCILTSCEPHDQQNDIAPIPRVAVSSAAGNAPADTDPFVLPDFQEMLHIIKQNPGELTDAYKAAYFPDWNCANFSIEGVLEDNMHYTLILTEEDCGSHHEEKIFSFNAKGAREDSITIHRGNLLNAWPLGQGHILQTHYLEGEFVKYLLEIGDVGQMSPDFSVPDNILGCIDKLPSNHPRLDPSEFSEKKGRFVQLWGNSTLDVRNGYFAYQFPGEKDPMYSMDLIRSNGDAPDLLLTLYRECKGSDCSYEMESFYWDGENLVANTESVLPAFTWEDFIPQAVVLQKVQQSQLPLQLRISLPWHGDKLKVAPLLNAEALAALNPEEASFLSGLEESDFMELALTYSPKGGNFVKK